MTDVLAQGRFEPYKISAIEPTANQIGVARTAHLKITLNQPVPDSSQVDNFKITVFGTFAGVIPGTTTLEPGRQVISFAPAATFYPGELVTAVFTIHRHTGQKFGFVWNFVVAASDGMGRFDSSRILTTGTKTRFVAAAELNQDPLMDLLTAVETENGQSRLIALMQKNENWTQVWQSNLLNPVKPLVLADVNADGAIDILAMARTANKMLLFLNNGTGPFNPDPDFIFEIPPDSRSAFVSDLDGDADLDLAVCSYDNSGHNNLWIYKNPGSGLMEVSERLDAGSKAQVVLGADWNANSLSGTIDLAVAASREIIIFDNSGTGQMTESQILKINSFDDESGVAGDFNGDGQCDLAFADATDKATVWGFNTYLNDADGQLQVGKFYPTGQWPNWTLAADIIRDNRPEILTVNYGSNSVSFYHNQGSDFADPISLSTFSLPRSLASADMNNDGTLDLIIAHENSDSLLIYFNDIGSNHPPDAPRLDSPASGNFSGSLAPKLSWLISNDADGDSLHFLVRLSEVGQSKAIPLTFSSLDQPELFEHLGGTPMQPPVPPASGFMRFQVPIQLNNVHYRWEVQAVDVRGAVSLPSQSWIFAVDNVAPIIHSIAFANQPFQDRWFKYDTTLVEVKTKVTYTEEHAKKLVLKAGEVLGTVERVNIPSGQQVSAEVVLKLPKGSPALADGQYPISVVLQDSVPLEASADSWFGLDGNYPQGCRIKALPETINTLTFPVSWEAGSDGAGVGLFGKYDVYFREDAGPWQLWLNDTLALSATFDRARDRHQYGFQAVTWDLLGNREPLAQKDEASIQVNLITDNSAPPAPINLKADSNASQSPWKKTDNFSITWQNPVDPSQIAKALYKLGSEPPLNQRDVTDSSTNLENMQIRATQPDGQWLYLWLRDGAGNADARNYAAVKLRWDNTVPQINALVLVNPTFGDNWYNPRVTSNIEFKIDWNEAHAAQLGITMTNLAGPVTFSPPIKKPLTLPIPIANVKDGFYDLTVTVQDSASNQTVKVAQLKLDSSAPINTRASSPPISSTRAFTVRWGATGEDGPLGSGLSGVYDVWKSSDGVFWELWLPRHRDGQAIYGDDAAEPSRHGQTWYFMAGAYDNVGNHEQPMAAQCNTKIDTTYADSQAPTAPINLKANGRIHASPWAKSAKFAITWLNPADPSGIDKIFYKLGGGIPTDSSDYTGVYDATGQQFSVQVKESEPVVWLYCWLADGKGNVNSANLDSVLLRHDGIQPKITSLNPSGYQAQVEGVYWFHPDSTEKTRIELIFNELIPAQVVFRDSLQTGLSFDTFEAGISHTVHVDYPLWRSDGRYHVQISLSDSAGNQADTLLTLGVDGAAPSGATARTEAVATKKNITVYWINQDRGDDGDGSGLSGAYKLQVRQDEGAWQEIATPIRAESYIFWGEDGHQYDFEVGAFDRVGNLESWQNQPEATARVNLSGIDRLAPGPPRNLRANGNSPSPWNNSFKFLLSWEEPANDYQNIHQGYYTLSSTPDTIVFPIHYPHSDTLTIVAQRQGIDTLFVWLQDSSKNVDSDSAASVLLRVDVTRPTIDSIRIVNSDFKTNWLSQAKTRKVQIAAYFTETNPKSASGALSGPFSQRFSGQIDAEEQLARFEIPIQQPLLPDGKYRFKLELVDAASNTSRPDSIEFFLDGTEPVLVHNTVALVTQGDSIIIAAKVTDNYRVDSAFVFYKLGGNRNYQKVAMTASTDSSYSLRIPATFTDSCRSIDYYLLASDGLNQATLPAEVAGKSPYSILVYYPGVNQQGLLKSQPQPTGSEQNGYRMISVPLNLEDARAQAFLEDDLGKLDKFKWRFFKFFPVQNEYIEYPYTGNVETGQAYWLITNMKNIVLDSGPGTTIRTDRDFVVRLRKGWNDIGNPFNFEVPVDKILASIAGFTGIMGPYTYDGSWRIPSEIAVLKPWEGYSFYSDKDDYSLAIPPLKAMPQLRKNQNKNLIWQIALRVRCQDAADLANYIGSVKEAQTDYDSLDYFEPPAMGAFVSLYFPHENWSELPGRYTTDFRGPIGQREEWDFVVCSNIPDTPIQLTAEVLQPLPADQHLVLMDLAQNQTLDLKNTTPFVFSLKSPTEERRFKLIVSKDVAAGDSIPTADTLPRTTRLVQNYPNPFNGSTTIEYEVVAPSMVEVKIYNLLAQKVRTLFEGHLEPGYYKATWDGKDDRGDDLGAGIYLLRLEAAGYRSIRKLIYVK